MSFKKDRPPLKDRWWVNLLVGGIIVIGFILSFTLIVFPPTDEPDPPSEIQCEPPLKNYNSVCSCGPEKELRKQPGGEMICAPMNT